MKAVFHKDKNLIVDGRTFELPYAIQEAFSLGEKVIVLLDTNDYLKDPNYSKERRRGDNPLKNLFALADDGSVMWEAEFPEEADCYYEIVSKTPLVAYSFSSYKCKIDPNTGKILSKEFLK